MKERIIEALGRNIMGREFDMRVLRAWCENPSVLSLKNYNKYKEVIDRIGVNTMSMIKKNITYPLVPVEKLRKYNLNQLYFINRYGVEDIGFLKQIKKFPISYRFDAAVEERADLIWEYRHLIKGMLIGTQQSVNSLIIISVIKKYVSISDFLVWIYPN